MPETTIRRIQWRTFLAGTTFGLALGSIIATFSAAPTSPISTAALLFASGAFWLGAQRRIARG